MCFHSSIMFLQNKCSCPCMTSHLCVLGSVLNIGFASRKFFSLGFIHESSMGWNNLIMCLPLWLTLLWPLLMGLRFPFPHSIRSAVSGSIHAFHACMHMHHSCYLLLLILYILKCIQEWHHLRLSQTLQASQPGPEASVKHKKWDEPCKRLGGEQCSMSACHLCPWGADRTYHSSPLLWHKVLHSIVMVD